MLCISFRIYIAKKIRLTLCDFPTVPSFAEQKSGLHVISMLSYLSVYWLLLGLVSCLQPFVQEALLEYSNLLFPTMNIWWHILIGCSSIVGTLSQEHGPGDPTEPQDPGLQAQPPYLPPQPDNDEDGDCDPGQADSPNGCKNCSEIHDECNDHLKCCEDFVCSWDSFCTCSNESKNCGNEDENSADEDDDTLLEAAKISLLVALVIAASALCVFLWKTCRKHCSSGNTTTRWQDRRRTTQQSLASLQQYMLSRLCDRPPRYEDSNYIQEEKPPPYEMVVTTVSLDSSLVDSAYLASTHSENAAYVEDGTEGLPPATHQSGVCLSCCASAVSHSQACPRSHGAASHSKAGPQCCCSTGHHASDHRPTADDPKHHDGSPTQEPDDHAKGRRTSQQVASVTSPT
ncbi:uncharacterized protein LOC134533878 [Bacillus rossius redtenbacheri]|uniref:uncharacterized protein LOC134533878 n=1 Tax=Bacillus rossius redtenbacheri TaxID=93214 RepID=UPI002FDCD998